MTGKNACDMFIQTKGTRTRTMEEKECCCTGKTKARTEEEYRSLIHRLSRIEGQVRGIRAMVEKGAYCTDILIQSAAVSAALSAFDRERLEPVIRSSICTGEKVAGFREKDTGRFREVCLIRSSADLDAFREKYGIEGDIPTIY